MIKLSFIVPFYNVEQYIEQCIRSLYKQDIPLDEYEVICIDDCSPDGSRAVVEHLKKEFPTLRLLRTPENLRQGGARNLGIKQAQGKYIWFVDSDDTIEPNCLLGLLNNAEEYDTDLLRFYFNEPESYDKMIKYGVCSGSELVFDAPMHLSPEQRCCSVVPSIVKRQLLIDNNLFFTEKVQYEDDDYAYMFYALSQRALLLPLPLYNVRQRQGSTTRQQYTIQTMHYLAAQIERLVQKEPQLSSIDKRWYNLVKKSILWTAQGQILPNVENLSQNDKQMFFNQHIGKIDGITKYVSVKTYLQISYQTFYNLLK